MTDAAAPAFATSRDRHLFGPGPKRILALDGGGVRGAITVAFLARIEALLERRYGTDVRLADHFDLIGGTSTGAIIAGALALGLRTAEVRTFYDELAPLAFKRNRWAVPGLRAKFDAGGLRRQIAAIVGARTLSSADLLTGFALVAKRMDTGSPWILSNSPRAPYWEDGKGGNKHLPLINLLRASTAAPHFFDPELLPIAEHAEPFPDAARLKRARAAGAPIGRDDYGLFVDGGVTPHGNPALALLQLATLEAYGIRWPARPDCLEVVSIGTGTFRPRMAVDGLGFGGPARLALHALTSLMMDTNLLVVALMQWMGDCPRPWAINSEVGTLRGDAPTGGKMFRFLRYDVKLEQDWLETELGLAVDRDRLGHLRHMDEPKQVQELFAIGHAAAERQVEAEHWLN
jgi:hypothetical protein